MPPLFRQQHLSLLLFLLIALGPVTCFAQRAWNSPYPSAEDSDNILYSSFLQRPKHLDPARAYSANEYMFIGQIYEPPLQYHYLKRPYQLIPLSATRLPQAHYFDRQGQALPAGADDALIAYSSYDIHIQPGMHYQPHPAFARDEQGELRYGDLDERRLQALEINVLGDFDYLGSREVVAADYVHQIRRLAHPQVLSPIFGLMSDYIIGLADLGKQLRQVYQQQGERKGWLDIDRYPFAGAEVIDRYTYRIKVHGKYPQLLYWLAMPFFAPLPVEVEKFYAQEGMAERNLSLDWYPLGSGPYMLTMNDPNQRMVLEKNPEFHGENYPLSGAAGDEEKGLLVDAGKPLPFVSKVVYSLEKEAIPYWNKFLQGYYDASGISSDSFDQAVSMGNGGDVMLTAALRKQGIQLQTAVNTSIYYLGFNMLDEQVGGYSESQRKLRQALSIAIDYEEYISIFANGRGIAAQGPLPPGIAGYRAGKEGMNPYVYDWRDGRPRRKSLLEARRLLAAAGYANGINEKTGKPLVLHLDITASGPGDKARLDWYRKQLQKIDVQLVIRNTDYNRFQEKMRQGNAQLFVWGWNADYPDPENFFFLLYGANGKVKHQGENAANYDDPRFNALFERMKAMDNGPRRQKIIDEMMRLLQRDAPWVWGFHNKSFSLQHAWYHNAKPNLMANNTLKYRRINAPLRNQLRLAWNQPIVWPLAMVAMLLLLFLLPAWQVHRRRAHTPLREQMSRCRGHI